MKIILRAQTTMITHRTARGNESPAYCRMIEDSAAFGTGVLAAERDSRSGMRPGERDGESSASD